MIAIFRSPLFLIIMLWAAGLGAAAQFSKIAVVFDIVQAHYNETGVLSGLLISSISIVGMFCGMVAGIFGARLGLRNMLIGGLVIGALASLYQAALPNLWMMLFSRAVEGMSHLAIVVAIPTLIAQFAGPKWQATALTFWATFFSLAFAATALIAPFLLENYGLKSLFLGHGIYMLFFALLFLFLLPRERQIDEPADKISLNAIIEKHREAYASPKIMLPGIAWLFYATAYVATLAVLPPFIASEDRSIAITYMPLISLVVSMTLGMVFLRFMPAIRLVQLGYACTIASAIALLNVGPNLEIALVIYASFGLIQGAGFASVPQLNSTAETRALSNGGLAQMGNLGTAIGTPILIGMVGFFGFTGLPTFLVACFAIALLSTQLLSKKMT